MVIPVIWVWRYDCQAGRIVVGVKFAPLKNLVKQLFFLFPQNICTTENNYICRT